MFKYRANRLGTGCAYLQTNYNIDKAEKSKNVLSTVYNTTNSTIGISRIIRVHL